MHLIIIRETFDFHPDKMRQMHDFQIYQQLGPEGRVCLLREYVAWNRELNYVVPREVLWNAVLNFMEWLKQPGSYIAFEYYEVTELAQRKAIRRLTNPHEIAMQREVDRAFEQT